MLPFTLPSAPTRTNNSFQIAPIFLRLFFATHTPIAFLYVPRFMTASSRFWIVHIFSGSARETGLKRSLERKE